jgi:hypothetical protein
VTFDQAKTNELERLFAVPREERDEAWRDAFFAAVPDAALATGEHQVIRGPDGLPYFRLVVPKPYAEFETFSVNHVLGACLEHGFGIVVMRDGAEQPEWVFRYGELWGYREEGRFATPPEPTGIDPTASVLFGSPTDAVLPPYARGVLRRVLTEAGVEPGVLLLTQPGAVPERSLVLPVYPDQFPDEAAFGDFMGRLTWYLPPGLGLAGAPRGAEGVPDFGPL